MHRPNLAGKHFQTDCKQKKHNAEFGNVLQVVNVLTGNGARGVWSDDDSSDNKAQNGPETKTLKQDDA